FTTESITEAEMREFLRDLRRRKPSRENNGGKPFWQRVSGLEPGEQSGVARRASLARLLCLVLLWFRSELNLDDGGGFAPVVDLDEFFGREKGWDREDFDADEKSV